MPILPDSHNPFSDSSVLAALGIDPFLTQDELGAAIEQASAGLAALPEAERSKRQALIAEAGKLLRNSRQRTLTIFRHYDRPGPGTLRQRLEAAALQFGGGPLTLPAPSMAQVFTEGASVALAQPDFNALGPEPTMLRTGTDLSGVPVSDTAEPYLELDL